MKTKLKDLKPIAWKLFEDKKSQLVVTLERGMFCGDECWRILRDRNPLTKSGQFISLPLPSSRSNELIETYTFPTPEAALEVWDQYKFAALKIYYPERLHEGLKALLGPWEY